MLATELAWSAWESFLVAPELSTFPSCDDIMISNAENFAIYQNLVQQRAAEIATTQNSKNTKARISKASS
ncbi:hypothetical protein [Bradyrhizobium lablabi]|jgi:hypothetical protein|uniref:hypothetical protein n=1 Tax=Bradyrhizobium lablabi TaxID=722472 RepID=UPI0012AC0496|nr:hypothetical protein [Bradyrhizobium lablabi]